MSGRGNYRWVSAARSMISVMALSCGVSAAAQVQDLYKISDGVFDAAVDYQRVELAPGQELVLADLKGPGKVTYFYVTDSSQEHISRDLILKIFWDGAAQPSIQVPLADFFGAFENKSIDYNSLPMQVNHYANMSHLPMPFSERARFVVVNDSDKSYNNLIAWGIDYEKDAKFSSETSRLHAAWSRSNPVKGGEHKMLEIAGKGQYIGNFLQANSNYEGWWGEGDTIFEIDGRKITHSPGTEDEYGSTWGFGHTFSYPYAGYIQMDKSKNRMYRWYLTNPVHFKESLRVYIENKRFQIAPGQAENPDAFKHGQTVSEDDYTSVVFWYQVGAHPAPRLLPYAERVAASRGASYRTDKP